MFRDNQPDNDYHDTAEIPKKVGDTTEAVDSHEYTTQHTTTSKSFTTSPKPPTTTSPKNINMDGSGHGGANCRFRCSTNEF